MLIILLVPKLKPFRNMKKIFSTFIILCSLFIGTTSFAQLSGIVTLGTPGGTFPSITGAGGLFQAINTVGLSGDLTVAVVGNCTEDGSNALNAIASGFGVYITPSSATTYIISGTGIAANAMIRFNGVRKIYIEGSFAGAGQFLVFQNYNSTAANTTPVFEFINEARAIAVRNCFIRSNTATSTNASVRLAGTTGTLGNDSIYVTKNIFEGINSERYVRAIYSSSVAVFPASNSRLAFTSNTFRKWSGTSTAVMDLTSIGDSVAVDSNYFYNDTAQTAAINIINYNSATSVYNSISFNSIGGSASDRSGATLLNANGTTLQAIRVTVGSASLSTVRNNVIANISGNDAVTTNIIVGILGVGRLEIFSNTIGGLANPWDTVHCTYDNGLITVSGGLTDTINVVSNTISNVSYYRKKNDRLCGLLINSGFRVNAYYNTFSNFKANNAVVSTSFNVFPIRTLNGTANHITNINNNVVNNIQNFSDSTLALSFAGICYAGGTATGTTNIYSNKISDLTCTNTNTGVNAPQINGIQIASTTGNVFVYNNAISLATQTGTEAQIRGILHSVLNTGTMSFLYNSIYIAGSTTGATNYSYGFYRSSTGPITFRNNIVYYNRTGGAGGFPMCVQNAANWQDTSANNNLYIGAITGNIGAFNTTNIGLDFGTWKTNSLGDKSSLSDVVANVSSASLWTATASANMSLIPGNSEAWYAYGQGTPVNYPSISRDINDVQRSISVVGGTSAIGCADLAAAPTAAPPIITNSINALGTYNFSFGGKLMASITINAPTSGFNFNISLRHFGGKIPPGANHDYAAFYDSIYVTGSPVALNYDVNLYSYPEQFYNMTVPANTRIVKSSNQGVDWVPQLANGSYTVGPPAFATATGLNSFSIFTLTSTNNPMPVELASFSSNVNRNKVELN